MLGSDIMSNSLFHQNKLILEWIFLFKNLRTFFWFLTLCCQEVIKNLKITTFLSLQDWSYDITLDHLFLSNRNLFFLAIPSWWLSLIYHINCMLCGNIMCNTLFHKNNLILEWIFLFKKLRTCFPFFLTLYCQEMIKN